jgi:hypothetical protein
VYLSVDPIAKSSAKKPREPPVITQRRIRIHWVSVPPEIGDQGPTTNDKVNLIVKPAPEDDEPEEGDLIGLFGTEPDDWAVVVNESVEDCLPVPDWQDKAVAVFEPAKYPDGFIVTQFELPKYNFGEGDLSGPRNLGFYCGYFR